MPQINEVPKTVKASRRIGVRSAFGAGILSVALLAGGVGIAGAATATPSVHKLTASMERASKDSSKDVSKDRSSGVSERSSRDSYKDTADNSADSYDG